MNIARALTAITLWIGLSMGVMAQTVINDPNGFKTQIPAGFQVKQDASGTVAADAAQTTILVMKAHTYANFQAFAADANLERDGFTLVGEARALSDSVYHFRASKPKPEGGYLIADSFVAFAPQGGGCLTVALSNEKTADSAYNSGLQVVSKLEFTRVAASAAAAGNVWDQALRGKHLLYLYTGNGYSERFDIFLLANGNFIFRSNMSSTSMNGSGVAGGNSDGNWQITPNGQLVLGYFNGKRAVYTLAPRQAGNEVSLNGQRYFVMTQ